MTHTVETLMALAYKIRDARTYEWDVSEAVEAGKALRKALTEALEPKGCISNCDTCTYHHQSPAQAGYCYMFYEEPLGVCGQWKDYAGLQSAQPVPPHECKTDAEKLAYAAGWWKALEANRAQPVREPLTAQVLHDFSPIFGGDK